MDYTTGFFAINGIITLICFLLLFHYNDDFQFAGFIIGLIHMIFVWVLLGITLIVNINTEKLNLVSVGKTENYVIVKLDNYKYDVVYDTKESHEYITDTVTFYITKKRNVYNFLMEDEIYYLKCNKKIYPTKEMR